MGVVRMECSAINICVVFNYMLYASHYQIFLTIQSHNLNSHKFYIKSPKLSNLHNFILA